MQRLSPQCVRSGVKGGKKSVMLLRANLAGFKSQSVKCKINKQPVQGDKNSDDMISASGTREEPRGSMCVTSE